MLRSLLRRLRLLAPLLLISLVATSCPPSSTPVVSLSFPGAMCDSDLLDVDIKTGTVRDSNQRTFLVIDVCITCGGTALRAVTADGMFDDADGLDITAAFKRPFTGTTGADGCVQFKRRIRGFSVNAIDGNAFTVQIKDDTGVVVRTMSVDVDLS